MVARAVAGGLLVLGAVLAQVSVITCLALYLLVRVVRIRWTAGLFTLAAGTIGMVVVGPVASLAAATSVPRQLLAAAAQQIAEPGAAPLGNQIASVLTQWPEWLWGQLPWGLVIGSLAGMNWCFWSWRHTDVWNERVQRKGLWARYSQLRIDARIRGGLVATPDATVLGIDNTTGGRLDLTDDDRIGHVLVVGANGSGKTTTARRLVEADLDRARPVILLDLKGSRDDRDEITTLCRLYDRPLVTFTLDGGSWWDPFRVGSRDERRDMFISGYDWTGAPGYYKEAATLLVQVALEVLDATAEIMPYESTLAEVVMMTNLAALQRRAQSITLASAAGASVDKDLLTGMIANLFEYVRKDPKVLDGYAMKLTIVRNTEAGRWMRLPHDPDGSLTDVRRGITYIDGHPVLDVAELRRIGAATLFSLSKARDKDMTARLGRICVQSLIAMFGQVSEQKTHVQRTLVLVDEFSALESALTTELLARGRSAGADVVLSTQTIEDIEIAADAKAAIGQTLGNVNVIIAHSIRFRPSAEAVAATAGTRTWVKRRMGSEANQAVLAVNKGAATGADLMEEDIDFPMVQPTVIQDLGTGQFVLIVGATGAGTPKRVVTDGRTIRTIHEHADTDIDEVEHGAADALTDYDDLRREDSGRYLGAEPSDHDAVAEDWQPEPEWQPQATRPEPHAPAGADIEDPTPAAAPVPVRVGADATAKALRDRYLASRRTTAPGLAVEPAPARLDTAAPTASQTATRPAAGNAWSVQAIDS